MTDRSEKYFSSDLKLKSEIHCSVTLSVTLSITLVKTIFHYAFHTTFHTCFHLGRMPLAAAIVANIWISLAGQARRRAKLQKLAFASLRRNRRAPLAGPARSARLGQASWLGGWTGPGQTSAAAAEPCERASA